MRAGKGQGAPAEPHFRTKYYSNALDARRGPPPHDTAAAIPLRKSAAPPPGIPPPLPSPFPRSLSPAPSSSPSSPPAWGPLPLAVLSSTPSGVAAAAVVLPTTCGSFEATARLGRASSSSHTAHPADGSWRWLGEFGENARITVLTPSPTIHRLVPPPLPHAAAAVVTGMAVAARVFLGRGGGGGVAPASADGSAPPPLIPSHPSRLPVEALLLDPLEQPPSFLSSSATAAAASFMVRSPTQGGGASGLGSSPSSVASGLSSSGSSGSSSFGGGGGGGFSVTTGSRTAYFPAPSVTAAIADALSPPTAAARPGAGCSAAAYVAGLVAMVIAHTMANTPRQSGAHFTALVQLLACLPALRNPSTRGKIVARLLGLDTPSATAMLDDLSRVPLDILAEMAHTAAEQRAAASAAGRGHRSGAGGGGGVSGGGDAPFGSETAWAGVRVSRKAAAAVMAAAAAAARSGAQTPSEAASSGGGSSRRGSIASEPSGASDSGGEEDSEAAAEARLIAAGSTSKVRLQRRSTAPSRVRARGASGVSASSLSSSGRSSTSGGGAENAVDLAEVLSSLSITSRQQRRSAAKGGKHVAGRRVSSSGGGEFDVDIVDGDIDDVGDDAVPCTGLSAQCQREGDEEEEDAAGADGGSADAGGAEEDAVVDGEVEDDDEDDGVDVDAGEDDGFGPSSGPAPPSATEPSTIAGAAPDAGPASGLSAAPLPPGRRSLARESTPVPAAGLPAWMTGMGAGEEHKELQRLQRHDSPATSAAAAGATATSSHAATKPSHRHDVPLAGVEPRARTGEIGSGEGHDDDDGAARGRPLLLSSDSSSSAAGVGVSSLLLARTPNVFRGPVMTVRQRALLALGRWASGAHWEPSDPLQPLALDLFLNALQYLSPAYVHQQLVVHVIQSLCCSLPTSIVRVYFARALRTLFGKGSASPSATVTRGEGPMRQRVPNLARGVVVAIHDIIQVHVADMSDAQYRSRSKELPPLSPVLAQRSALPSLAMPTTSTPATADTRHKGMSPSAAAAAAEAAAAARQAEQAADAAALSAAGGAEGEAVFPSGRAREGGGGRGGSGRADAAQLLPGSPHTPARGHRHGPHIDTVHAGAGLLPSQVSPGRGVAGGGGFGVGGGGFSTPAASASFGGGFRSSSPAPSSALLPASHLLAPSEVRRLDTSGGDSDFDLAVLMAFVGDLLHESKSAESTRKAAAAAGARGASTSGRSGSKSRSRSSSSSSSSTRGVSATGPEDDMRRSLTWAQKTGADLTAGPSSSSSDGGSSCGSSLSCSGCTGGCSLRRSTLTEAADPGALVRIAADEALAHGAASTPSASGRLASAPPSRLAAVAGSEDAAFDMRSPHVARPYTHQADTTAEAAAEQGRVGVVGEGRGGAAAGAGAAGPPSPRLQDVASFAASLSAAAAATGPTPPAASSSPAPSVGQILAAAPGPAPASPSLAMFASACATETATPGGCGGEEAHHHHQTAAHASLSPNSSTPTGPARAHRADLVALCPASDRGGLGLGLWIEVATGVATAAVRLSSVPDGGDGVTAEYKSVLTCALQLCSACPLLREVVLRRLLRKWPAGNSDNEVALLEFLATLLANTAHRADLIVTDLRGALFARLRRCLGSRHIKVARNALVLADPTRRLVDFLVDDRASLALLLHTLADNAGAHWNPLVRKASAAAHAVYSAQYDLMMGGKGGGGGAAAAGGGDSPPGQVRTPPTPPGFAAGRDDSRTWSSATVPPPVPMMGPTPPRAAAAAAAAAAAERAAARVPEGSSAAAAAPSSFGGLAPSVTRVGAGLPALPPHGPTRAAAGEVGLAYE